MPPTPSSIINVIRERLEKSRSLNSRNQDVRDNSFLFNNRDCIRFSGLNPCRGDIVVFERFSRISMAGTKHDVLPQKRNFARDLTPISICTRTNELIFHTLDDLFKKCSSALRLVNLESLELPDTENVLSCTQATQTVCEFAEYSLGMLLNMLLYDEDPSQHFPRIFEMISLFWECAHRVVNIETTALAVRVILDMDFLQKPEIIRYFIEAINSEPFRSSNSPCTLCMHSWSIKQINKLRENEWIIQDEDLIQYGRESEEDYINRLCHRHEECFVYNSISHFLHHGVAKYTPKRVVECLYLIQAMNAVPLASTTPQNHLVFNVLETISASIASHQSFSSYEKQRCAFTEPESKREDALSSKYTKINWLPNAQELRKITLKNSVNRLFSATEINNVEKWEQAVNRILELICSHIMLKSLTWRDFRPIQVDSASKEGTTTTSLLEVEDIPSIATPFDSMDNYRHTLFRLAHADTFQPIIEVLQVVQMILSDPKVIPLSQALRSQTERKNLFQHFRQVMKRSNTTIGVRTFGCGGFSRLGINRNSGGLMIHMECIPLQAVQEWENSPVLSVGNLVCIASTSALTGKSSEMDGNQDKSVFMWGVISSFRRDVLDRNKISSPTIPIELLQTSPREDMDTLSTNESSFASWATALHQNLVLLQTENCRDVWLLEFPIFYAVQKAVIEGFMENTEFDTSITEEERTNKVVFVPELVSAAIPR